MSQSDETNRQTNEARKYGDWDPHDPVLILAQLMELHNRLLTPFNAHLKKQHHISLNEFRTFMTLGRLEPAAAHEISNATGLSTMTVSRAVAALEEAGRVRVRRNEANRRSNMLTLTPAGKKLFKEMLPISARVADYVLAEFSGAERGKFRSQLDALLARLKMTDDKGRSLFIEATRPTDE